MSRVGRGRFALRSLIIPLAAVVAVLTTVLLYSLASGTVVNVITSPDTAGQVGRHTSLELDAVGNPVISYFDPSDALGSSTLKVLHCGDSTCSSGNVIVAPDPTPGNGEYTSLELDTAGNPVVSYWYGQLNDLRVLHCGNPSCSAGNSIATPDSMGGVGQYTSLSLDSNGYPVVSYYDSTNNDLKVLHCGDSTCSSGNVITSPDSVGIVGLWTSLALDANDHPVVSYFDLTNFDLKVLHCGDSNCTTGNVINSPDTVGGVGEWTSLALDASGNPVVSYLGQTNFDLKVLHCGDPNCSTGNVITAPDTGGNVGQWSSLVLGPSGNPAISYYDESNDDLKVLSCGDPTCSAGNVITSPDTAGDVGTENSLLLDASGNPVVSYYDAFPNYDLKVLRCGHPTCGQDSDGDGIVDALDNCPNVPNPGQEDANGDGIADACESQSPVAVGGFAGLQKAPHSLPVTGASSNNTPIIAAALATSVLTVGTSYILARKQSR